MDSSQSAVDAAPPLGAIDSTHRTQHEPLAALGRADARYRSISENCIEGVFHTTLDGRYSSANPASTWLDDHNSALPRNFSSPSAHKFAKG